MWTYWDRYDGFHKHCFEDVEAWRPYKPAVNTLKEIFKPLVDEKDTREHPVLSRITAGYIENYKWMDLFGRFLLKAQSIPGIDNVWHRLGIPVEYPSVLTEIEVAMIYELAGHDVRFIECEQDRTPDLEVQLNGITFNIEVTSLNRPDMDMYFMQFNNEILKAASDKVATGGSLSPPKNKKELLELCEKFRSAAKRAKENESMEKVEIHGLANIWLAYGRGVEEIPTNIAGRFSYDRVYGRTIEEKLVRKIREKGDQLTYEDNPSILFVYSRIPESLSEPDIYTSEDDGLDRFLATCPSISELVLIGPESFSPQEEPIQYQELSSNKTCFPYPSGDRRPQPCVVWNNQQSRQVSDISAVQLIQDFPSHLSELPTLE